MASLRARSWIILLAFACGCSGGGESAGNDSAASSGLAESGSENVPVSRPVKPPEPSRIDEAELATRQAAMDADPDNPRTIRPLAIALLEVGQGERAVELFERAVEIDADVRSLLDLGLSYTKVSRYPEAEATYGRLLEISPRHPIVLHNLGNVATVVGDTDRGIELYRQAISVKPDYLLAFAHLGDALKIAGHYREAYTTYSKVLQLEPTTGPELEAFDDALYKMAALDITMGAHQRAVEMLELLIEEHPDHPSAHYAYGQALLQLGRPEEAQREFETHMRILAEIEPTAPMAAGR